MALRPYSTHTKFPHVLPATRAFPNPPREKQGIWCARYILGSRTPGIRSAYAAPPNPSASSSGRISHSQLLADDPSAPLAAPSVRCVGLACCVVSGAWLVVSGAEFPGLVAGVEVVADTSVVGFAASVVCGADCWLEGISVGVVRAADTSDEAGADVVAGVEVVADTSVVGFAASVVRAAESSAVGSVSSVVRAADTSDEVVGATATVDSFAEVVVRAADTSEVGVDVVAGAAVAADTSVLGFAASVVRGADCSLEGISVGVVRAADTSEVGTDVVAGAEVAADTSVTVVGVTSVSDGSVVSASGLLMYCCSSFCRSSMSCSSFFASSRLWVSSSISI